MLFLAYNKTLIKDGEKTSLTSAVSSTGTTITVKNNDGFANGDYFIIGEIGSEKAEIKAVNGAVTAGTSLTVTALTFDHDIDEPVYRIPYNQVEFSRATTLTGNKSVLNTISIQPDDDYTRYEDTANTTGYGFIRFKNSTSSAYSSYSVGIPYTGYTKKSRRKIREKIRRLLNEPDETKISDEEINDEINLFQSDIAHTCMFKAYESTKSFSTVANQFEYDLASDVYVLFNAKYDTQPLNPTTVSRWDMFRWDSDVSGEPTHLTIWKNKARLYPYPSSSADTTTLGADATASATSLTVADSSSLRSQGRVIIDSEVISYTGTTSTTLTGCTRGEEGTTAATHSSGATVTERDIIYHFQEDPADLDDETDETGLDPLLVAYGVAKDLALELDKDGLSDRLEAKFTRQLNKSKANDTIKFKGSYRIVNTWQWGNGNWQDPNMYPQNIS